MGWLRKFWPYFAFAAFLGAGFYYGQYLFFIVAGAVAAYLAYQYFWEA